MNNKNASCTDELHQKLIELGNDFCDLIDKYREKMPVCEFQFRLLTDLMEMTYMCAPYDLAAQELLLVAHTQAIKAVASNREECGQFRSGRYDGK